MSTAKAPVAASNVIGGNISDARYDRQIRLWGKQGQIAVQGADIVALGATATICAALKSIILTGVRSVTLVDERTVTRDDVASNFFLSIDNIGAPLAECALRHLCELNGDCAGLAWTAGSPQEWGDRFAAATAHSASASASSTTQGQKSLHRHHDPQPTGAAAASEASSALASLMGEAVVVANHGALHGAQVGAAPDGADAETSQRLRLPQRPTLILVSNRYPDLSAVSPLVLTATRRLDVPVILVESRGLLGCSQVFARDRVVIYPLSQSQPMEDLRILEPFPELKEWFDRHHPDDETQFLADDTEGLVQHSHLPPICILHHAYRRYVEKANEEQRTITWPLKREDLVAIKQEVHAMKRREDPPQEGFQAAMETTLFLLNRPMSLPPSLEALFRDPRCAQPSQVLLTGALQQDEEAAANPWASIVDQDATALAWYVIRAIKAFYDASDASASAAAADTSDDAPRHKVLPFCGHVPDMTTLTSWFQELREIYGRKHAGDVQRVCELTREAIEDDMAALAVGRPPRRGGEGESEADKARAADLHAALVEFRGRITDEQVETTAGGLVKNIWVACSVSFSAGFVPALECPAPSLREAWRSALRRQLRLARAKMSEKREQGILDSMRACGAGLVLYAAHELEYERHAAAAAEARKPDCPEGDGDAGAGGKLCLFTVLEDLLLRGHADAPVEGVADVPQPPPFTAEEQALLTKLCCEVERVGDSEVPFVAAVLGAIAAQEAIKLVQHRHIPYTFPMVYSGIDGVFANLPN